MTNSNVQSFSSPGHRHGACTRRHRRRAKGKKCTELIKFFGPVFWIYSALCIWTRPGSCRQKLVSHLTRSSFKNGKQKPRAAHCDRQPQENPFFYIFVWRNLQPSYRFPLSSSFRREQSLSMSIYWCINTDPSFSIRTHTQDTTPTHTSYSYYNRCYPTLKTSATIVCIKETTVFQQARLLGRVGHNMVKLLWIACDTVAAIFQLTSGELTQVSDETMYLG